jgi:hypothetical protein
MSFRVTAAISLTGSHDSERVAVWHRVRDQFIAENSAGTRLVFNNHWLAKSILHRFREYPADDVGAATRAKRNNDVDRLLGPFLGRLRPRGRDQAQDRSERRNQLFHEHSFCLSRYGPILGGSAPALMSLMMAQLLLFPSNQDENGDWTDRSIARLLAANLQF